MPVTRTFTCDSTQLPLCTVVGVVPEPGPALPPGWVMATVNDGPLYTVLYFCSTLHAGKHLEDV